MKFQKTLFPLLLLGIMFSLSNCDSVTPKEDTHNSLRVKFTNEKTSVVTITSIFVQPMGEADKSNTPQGDWSADLLPDEAKIAPGESKFFTLSIPNLEWSRYRLGVDDGSGKEILLHEQNNYTESNLPIEHWGSDDRTVSVQISKDFTSGNYYVSGWTDMAGIE